MKNNSLGSRMKGYEHISRNFLTRRTPVIIRLDGKAFHTFTRGLKKPFDDVLMLSMQKTAQYLCENVQGCKIAYTQSDEISLLLTDYEKLDTSAWFDNNIQKISSISASMATLAFNSAFSRIIQEHIAENKISREEAEMYSKKEMKAMFDSRVFSIPKEEVNNYFVWRQQDCVRNSIQMVGQSNFSNKELHKKNCDEIQEMLFQKVGINWSSYPTFKKRGSCIVKEEIEKNGAIRSVWIVDLDIPNFANNKEYINQLV